MIRAVIDSSVFVSAALGLPSSPPSAVFEAWEDGGFELIDDYLVALARAAGGVLVSGDRDLLEADVADVEIFSPREFLARLEAA